MPNPSTGLQGQYLDSIGIELEGVGIFQPNLSREIRNTFSRNDGRIPLQITRDASVESYAESINVGDKRVWVYTHSKLAPYIRGIGNGNTSAIGYEAIVSPQTVPEFEEVVTKVLRTIENAGDFISRRAAIHYHVGYANNLALLKNLLRVCLWLDPFFFRLGGMGRAYRGSSNLSAYARPLLHSPAVRVGEYFRLDGEPISRSMIDKVYEKYPPNSWVKISNPIAALDANNVEEFWGCFGVFPTRTGLPKYHPVRYSSFNFYALAMHGTIESRHFNQSFNAPLVVACGKLFRAVVELASSLGKHEVFDFAPGDSSVEITMEDASLIVETLTQLFSEKEIEFSPTVDEFSLILETMEKSSFKALPPTPVKSHVRETFIPANLAMLGSLEIVKDALEPIQVDIHTIKHQPFIEDIE